ncbi:MAG: hypothetical protein KBC17_02245 [Candidatus Pacebacteria bacterium]|nr:hypothetical protein [Candidatus Paceibacterota bacterium]
MANRQIYMLKIALIATLVYGGFFPVSVFAETESSLNGPQALLYVTNSPKSLASLREHVSANDIISPQTYTVNSAGKLFGVPKKEVLEVATKHGAKVMPLVSNQNFNQKTVHAFLINKKAQTTLVNSLIKEAKKRKYIGYQYDFEHMLYTDRNLYSSFVKKSAESFHKAGLKLSVAVSPLHSDDALAYGPGSWKNWTGAFDYKALGESADFISVMAYDDSLSVGPVASLPWVEQVIDYSLKKIPAHKISIGIPAYAWVWNDKTGKRVRARGYSSLEPIISSGSFLANGHSDEHSVSYLTYAKDNIKYTAWYEDGKSFERKLALAKSKGIQSYSLWALGLEHPELWNKKALAELPDSGLNLASSSQVAIENR